VPKVRLTLLTVHLVVHWGLSAALHDVGVSLDGPQLLGQLESCVLLLLCQAGHDLVSCLALVLLA